MARLAGMVQGVVVQITTEVRSWRPPTSRSLANSLPADFPEIAARAAAHRQLARKGHIDRIADMVFIFDFGFCQRGLFDDAPHHRLRAAIEQPVCRKFHDLARDCRLGGIAHGEVRMRPVADDAETDEFVALNGDPMFGEGRHWRRNSLTGTSSLLRPFSRYSSSIFHSIGRP